MRRQPEPSGLEDKTVLVTGSSGGIGFEIARKFLEAGSIVGAHYRHKRSAIDELVALGGSERCKPFQADFSDSGQVSSLWESFVAWRGTIDVLVNNAAEVTQPASFDELSEEAWDGAFQVNLKAPFLLSRAAMPIMRRKSFGRIINICSIGVKFGGGSTTIHYSASKAALEALTLSLARVGARENVLVNAIRVGVTDTPLHEGLGRDGLLERAKLIPLGRPARPSEIADSALFLASSASSFISGSILTVSGGE